MSIEERRKGRGNYERKGSVPNNFDHRGLVTAIIITLKDGNIHEALIDSDDMAIVSNHRWYYDRQNYALTYIKKDGKRKSVYLHRLVMGDPDSFVIDHINHNGLDNRKENLKICTRAQNSQNRIGPQRDTTSGVRGVTWNKRNKKWKAYFRANNKEVVVGYFDSIFDAEIAVKSARSKYMENSPHDLASIDFTEVKKQELIKRLSTNFITNKSGFKGVHWDKKYNKWRACIKIKGKYTHLGYFGDVKEAAEASRIARVNLIMSIPNKSLEPHFTSI